MKKFFSLLTIFFLVFCLVFPFKFVFAYSTWTQTTYNDFNTGSTQFQITIAGLGNPNDAESGYVTLQAGLTSGYLISASFDTTVSASFGSISWNGDASTTSCGADSIKFQVATNNDNSTWNFIGPDGTGSSYYATSSSSNNSLNREAIYISQNGKRYIKYKLYLSCSSSSYMPRVDDVSIIYVETGATYGSMFYGSGKYGGIPSSPSSLTQKILTGWTQTNWSNGTGQAYWADATKYYSDNGNIDNTTSGQIKLTTVASTGQLTSSLFNTGQTTTFDSIAISSLALPTSTAIGIEYDVDEANTWPDVGTLDATGSTGTTFTLSNVSGQKIKYRANLQKTGTNTPTLLEITTNYQAPVSWGGITTQRSLEFGFSQQDSDPSDLLRYRIQIDNDSDFSSPIIDYRSAISSSNPATRTFEIGQTEEADGQYIAGENVFSLPDASYYWRAKSIDSGNNESSWTNANSGAIAFQVGTSLSFSISGVNSNISIEGITTDATSTSSGVPFGLMVVDSAKEGAQVLEVSTNALNGYNVGIQQNHNLQNGSNEIPAFSGTNLSPSVWTSPSCTGSTDCGYFGYHSGDHNLGTGSLTRFTSDNTFAGLISSLDEVAFSNLTASNEQTNVVFKIQAGNYQPSGGYSNMITYVVTTIY